MKPGWVQTVSGRAFWPLEPDPDHMCIDDIVHGLSLLCRFNGQTSEFYSVAEHSWLLSQVVPPEYALEALMHDGPEAYLPDICSPIKPFIVGFYEIEDRIMEAMAQKYDLLFPLPEIIKIFDKRIVADEAKRFMAPPAGPGAWDNQALGIRIEGFSPEKAKSKFLKRFRELRA